MTGITPVFVRGVKVGIVEEEPLGGYCLTWDSTGHRYWFATLEDVKGAFGNRTSQVTFGA